MDPLSLSPSPALFKKAGDTPGQCLVCWAQLLKATQDLVGFPATFPCVLEDLLAHYFEKNKPKLD